MNKRSKYFKFSIIKCLFFLKFKIKNIQLVEKSMMQKVYPIREHRQKVNFVLAFLFLMIFMPDVAFSQITFTPDGNYGINGTVVEPFNSAIYMGNSEYRAGILKKDGKLLLGGNTDNNQQSSFVVQRRTIHGNKDLSYGVSGGKLENFKGGIYDELSQVLFDEELIYLIGTHHDVISPPHLSGRFGVIVIQQDGTRNPDFNKGSNTPGEVEIVIPAIGASEGAYCNDATLDTGNSNLFLVGVGFNKTYASTKLSVAGKIDSLGYGVNGVIVEKDSSHLDYYTTSILMTSNNVLFAGGYTEDPVTHRRQLFITKRLSNGSPDLNFKVNGYSYTNLDSSIGNTDGIKTDDMVELPGGKVVLIGHDTLSLILACYNQTTGNSVANFGSGHGYAVLGSPLTTRIWDVAAEVDGEGNINLGYGTSYYRSSTGITEEYAQSFGILDSNGLSKPYSNVNIRVGEKYIYNAVYDLVIDPDDGSRYLIGKSGINADSASPSVIKLLPTAVGVAEIPSSTTDGVLLYPNPTCDILNVKLNDSEPLHFTILNRNGQVIKEGIISSINNQIDVSSCPAGIYILNVDGFGPTKVEVLH